MPAAVYIWQRVVRTKLTLRPTIEVHIRLESRLDLSDEKNDETAFNDLYLDTKDSITKDSINGVHFHICLRKSSNSLMISISL